MEIWSAKPQSKSTLPLRRDLLGHDGFESQLASESHGPEATLHYGPWCLRFRFYLGLPVLCVSWMRISFLCGLGSLINRTSDTMRRAAAASASCQDLFVAGSPCTPYSVLYNCRGKPGFDPFETSAGQAFVAGLRYIREQRPRIAILEQAIVCKLISIVFFIFAVMCIFTVS